MTVTQFYCTVIVVPVVSYLSYLVKPAIYLSIYLKSRD